MTPNEFLKHSIDYDQLRVDRGMLLVIMADDNLSKRVRRTCNRLFNLLSELQDIVVENELLNADTVYGKIPDDTKS